MLIPKTGREEDLPRLRAQGWGWSGGMVATLLLRLSWREEKEDVPVAPVVFLPSLPQALG